MLRKCHGHGLTKGAIIQIFYHGLDEPTQGILDETAGGIFLYKSPNQAFQFLEDKVLFKLDWSTKSQNEHHQKSVSFADGKLNNDVKNDLEDFKICIRSMRTVNWKLFARDDDKTTGVLPNKESKTAPLFVSWSTWWFRDSLAYLKLSLGSSIYRVWKLVDTPYRAMWDTAYWGFLGVRIHREGEDGDEGGGVGWRPTSGGGDDVMRVTAGVWGSDDGDDHEGGVMVGCGGEAAGGGGGAWRRVDMGIG
ncbi:hypothetical protein Tco_0422817 [Tanacetum coccineum]